MDEPKPDHSQAQNPVEESQDVDGGLVSKLARAHSTLPPEQRWASSLQDSSERISNPELEDKFQTLLKQQQVLATFQGQRHKPDPATLALLEKRIEQLQARGDGFSDATSAGTKEDEIVSGISGSQCHRCGQANPTSYRFCGMCGAELTKASNVIEQVPPAAPNAILVPPEADVSPSSLAPAIQGRFHRGFRVAFFVLLLAVLGLLLFGEWSFWRRQRPSNETARAVNALPPTPAPGANRAGRTAGKAHPRPGPPVVVKQPLPAAVPAPTPLASAAEVPQEHSIIIPPSNPPVLKAADTPSAHESSSPPTVSQVTPAALIYKVNPEYPAIARSARVQGSVVMRAVIGTDGAIQQLELIKGNPLLVNAAMQAAKKWRYRPALLDGKPVEIETTVTINFKGE
jgi:TonB family protein